MIGLKKGSTGLPWCVTRDFVSPLARKGGVHNGGKGQRQDLGGSTRHAKGELLYKALAKEVQGAGVKSCRVDGELVDCP